MGLKGINRNKVEFYSDKCYQQSSTGSSLDVPYLKRGCVLGRRGHPPYVDSQHHRRYKPRQNIVFFGLSRLSSSHSPVFFSFFPTVGIPSPLFAGGQGCYSSPAAVLMTEQR